MTHDTSPPVIDPAADAELGSGERATEQGDGGADLPAVRALILDAHPDLVPDLVTGSTVAELLASVDGARAAYAAVAERLATSSSGGPASAGKPPAIPAGGGAPLPVDPDRLPASEKIRRGLRAATATTTTAAMGEGAVR